jgi:transposase
MKALHDRTYTWEKGKNPQEEERRCNMADYKLGCDVHKRYSQIAVLNAEGKLCQREKIAHSPEILREYLSQFPAGTPVAFETVGNWYWVAEAIEAAGCEPLLAHAAKAKVMMGNVNKSDKLDAEGLATLLHLGKLPRVWIPQAALRDERQLLRTRMFLSQMRTGLKNRIHAALAKYALVIEESDIFVGKGYQQLKRLLLQLPVQTYACVAQELELLEQIQKQIDRLEERIHQCVHETAAVTLLKTLPGFGKVFSALVSKEMGPVERFPDAEHFASYAGCVPKVASSGGKTHYGHLRKEANHYLKWAFIEAANVIVAYHKKPAWRNKHVVRLYVRTRQRKGHAVAVGAVARHLAEAAYWMLTRNQPYREPPADLPRQA